MALSAELSKTTVFITHDLDEAIRIGTRAIMKDGRIVQIGTPEEIVTDPIHDYVRDFVEGISTLKLLFAHSIMEPIDGYLPRPGEDLSLSSRAPHDTGSDTHHRPVDRDRPAHRDHRGRQGRRRRRQGDAPCRDQGW